MEEAELTSIFLKGLHPDFQPLQVHFAIPGTLPNKFEAVIEIVRKYAATPVVALELAKLKSSGLSQHMFPAFPANATPAAKLISSVANLQAEVPAALEPTASLCIRLLHRKQAINLIPSASVHFA